MGGDCCTQSCNSSYYQSDVTKQCYKCDPSCLTCKGEKANHCLSCYDQSLTLQSGQCQESCNPGYYENMNTKTCLACDLKCSLCESQTVCTKCTSGYYLQQKKQYTCLSICDLGFADPSTNQCSQICSSGYYPANPRANVSTCLPCSEGCKTCNQTIKSLGQCLKCNESTFLNGIECLTSCPIDLYPNKLMRKCQEYLNFTVQSKAFSEPYVIELGEDKYLSQTRFFLINFTEPLRGRLSLANLEKNLNITINGQYKINITHYDSYQIHFEAIQISDSGYINLNFYFSQDFFYSNITGSPLHPLILRNGYNQKFKGPLYFSFEPTRADYTLYILTGTAFIFTVSSIQFLTLCFKTLVDPRNYMFFTFIYNMQILAMLLFVELPHYAYLFMPFQCLQLWFNFTANASFMKSTDYDKGTMSYWGLNIPSEQYAPEAFMTVYDYFYVDDILSNLFLPLKDYQMSCNYISNYTFFFGVIIFTLELILMGLKNLRNQSITKAELTTKDRQLILSAYKFMRIVNIRTYQTLALNNYFYVILQLSYPYIMDPFSLIAYGVACCSLFGQGWVLYHFQQKLKSIVDYEDNSSAFQEFTQNYRMFFSSLRTTFNLKDQDKLLENEWNDQDKVNAATRQDLIDEKKVKEEMASNLEKNISNMIDQDLYLQKKYEQTRLRQVQNYNLILSYQLTFHLRAMLICLLIVLLQYGKSNTIALLVLIILTNLLMIFYYVYMLPYKDMVANLYQIYFEVTMIALALGQIYLYFKFKQLEDMEYIPKSDMEDVDKAVYFIVIMLYILFVVYIVTTIGVSIPQLCKKKKALAPPPPPPPKPLPKFDPTLNPKIQMPTVFVDDQKIQHELNQLRADGHREQTIQQFGFNVIELLDIPPEVREEELRREEEQRQLREKERKYWEKYGRRQSQNLLRIQ